MYRCYITIIIIFAIILSVSAQSENDSIRSLQLDEVLVKAKEVIADKLTGNIVKEIYVPGRIVNIVMK